MRIARVYRHSDTRQTLFADLEAAEVLGLLLLFGLFMFTHRGQFFLSLAVTALSFLIVRIAKRGKPPGYTTALITFTIRSLQGASYLSASAPDRIGRNRPFPIARGLPFPRTATSTSSQQPPGDVLYPQGPHERHPHR